MKHELNHIREYCRKAKWYVKAHEVLFASGFVLLIGTVFTIYSICKTFC